MGCNDSRKGYPEEEVYMVGRESELGFGKVKCSHLLRVITWHAQGQSLSNSTLKNAFVELSLPSPDKSPSSSALFSALKSSQSGLKRLQLVCVLLGKGKLQRKAEELWTMYNVEGDQQVAITTLAQMCHDLLSVSIEDLGRLDTTSRVREYFTGLRGMIEEYGKVMMDNIAKGQELIGKQEFVEGFRDLEEGKYLGASSLRCLVAEHKRRKSVPRYPQVIKSISSQALAPNPS